MRSQPGSRYGGITTRTLLLAAVSLVVIVAAGVLLSGRPWVRALFRVDVDNPAETTQLQGANLPTAATSDTALGWPQWFGPQRDGRAPAGPLRTDWDKRPPQKLWEAACGRGFGSLAVVGGKLYLHDRDGGAAPVARERLRCLDAVSGQPLWEHSYPADYSNMDPQYANGPRTTPTVEGNRVYTVGAVGSFVCVQAPDKPDGKPTELWRHDLLGEFEAKSPHWGVACSPLIEGDLVIVQPGGKAGSVAAFDKTTGALRWKAGDNVSGYSSPVAATVAGVRVIFALTGNALLAVGTDGQVLASYKWVTDFDGNIATPIVVGDYVFISSGYNHGCALLRVAREGEGVKLEEVYVRNNKVMRNHHSTSVYKDGFLYGFDNEDLKCVDFRRGRDVDGWESDRLGKGCLILANENLIVLFPRGELALIAAKPNQYERIAKLPSGLNGKNNWSLPVLVDGRLYLRDEEKILCLDVK